MANVIMDVTVGINLTVKKNGAVFSRSETMEEPNYAYNAEFTTGVMDISASGTELFSASNFRYGWVFVKNLSTASGAYVDIQESDNQPDDTICRVYAGQACIFVFGRGTSIYGDASGGTQAIEYALIEEL